jgi:hypothetical protein
MQTLVIACKSFRNQIEYYYMLGPSVSDYGGIEHEQSKQSSFTTNN